ncbi:MAG TPA: HK97-gp10 family putative phage morphogenesis protein [Phycisphaerae bacterium]|nr:HK97-gp10 family putative phage morphogenesis protein [Phycisphaerae bacterium]
MLEINVDQLELQKVTEALKTVAEDVRNDILVEAIDEAAEPIWKEMVAKCPVKSGALFRSLEKKRRTRKGLPALTMGPKGGFFKGKTFYAAFVELGHLAGSRKLGSGRKLVPAHPFMRPAFMANKAEAQRRAIAVIRRRLEAFAETA